MRNAFIKKLSEQARRDPSIWLLCGDIGYSVLEEFAKEFPDRFVNVGIAEQNMIGVAAGLAMTGKTVFTYTIGNFSFMRCLEQIRNDVCYHNLNVKIVALAGGFAYGAMGYTHHVVEDIAMMRVLPNITLLAPSDPVETAWATEILCKTPGPGYLRIGRGGEPMIHKDAPAFTLGKAFTLSQGGDATIIASAGALDIAQQAFEHLTDAGFSIGLVSMPTLVPFDYASIVDVAARTKALITIEEHGAGGLGTLVSECLTDQAITTPLHRICVRQALCAEAGDKAWLRKHHNITADAIIAIVKRLG